MSTFGRGVRLEIYKQDSGTVSVPPNANYYIFINKAILRRRGTRDAEVAFLDFLTPLGIQNVNPSTAYRRHRIVYAGETSDVVGPMIYTKVFFGGQFHY